jgi:hypothetical protein
MANDVCGSGSTIAHAGHIALTGPNDGTESTSPPSIALPSSLAVTPAARTTALADTERTLVYGAETLSEKALAQ